MFKDNKYTKWYNNIIDRARHRTLLKETYTERHHFIPKCLGGKQTVRLTAREHFICHLLLTKMSDDHRLKFALVMMSLKNKNQPDRYIIKSRTYEYIKQCNSEASSVRQKNTPSTHNICKVHCHDPETMRSYLCFPEQIPERFVLGRHPSFIESIQGQNKGNQYFYNPDTMKVISIKSSDFPPIGFVKGNPNCYNGDTIRGKGWWHNPNTFEEVKSKCQPEGFISGRGVVWVTNGKENKQIRKDSTVPTNWYYGKSGNPGKPNAIMRVTTPLGLFDHSLRFCEEYKCDISFFDSLDSKMKNRKSLEFLKKALTDVGYDFSKTKRENGFNFLKENDGNN